MYIYRERDIYVTIKELAPLPIAVALPVSEEKNF